MKRTSVVAVVLLGLLAGRAAQAHDDAGHAVVLPDTARVQGRTIGEWAEAWWHWTFRVPAARNPELVLDEDCGVGQTDEVFFVPMYDGSPVYTRTCRVPEHRPVLVPLWVLINDYPCPDPTFQPAPGQTLEQFLTEGVQAFNGYLTDLVVTVDGRLVDTSAHRHTSPLFSFQAHPSLVGAFPDPCLTGDTQDGVSDGWWLMLRLTQGEHEVRVRANTPMGYPVDFTYRLRVEG